MATLEFDFVIVGGGAAGVSATRKNMQLTNEYHGNKGKLVIADPTLKYRL